MGLLRAIMRRPLADTALVAHALVAHGAVAVLLRLSGLRGASACLARASRGRTTAVPRQTEDRIVWAVRTATHLLPAGRTCLTEALTAQYLVRRHGGDAELRIGVSRAAALQSHAWLEAAGRIIIGGETAADYTPLALPRR
jgi:hypothetical protein